MQYKLNLIFLILSTTLFSQSIITDETLNAQDLVNLLVNNSGCATVSSFSVSGGNFPTDESYAKFDYTGTDFPFSEGIILSTGKIINTLGPNNTLSDDGIGIGWNTDADLDAIFSNTENATVLEFDFTTVTDFISFKYIFASEEYRANNPSTCDFSDVFAFLIKPNTAGSSYTNIAIIPDTQIPVSVTSVHPEIPNGCAAQNETFFGSFNNSSYQPHNFGGQTKVLKAESFVTPNTSYHIKLVIADHDNARFDSAVFLEAGSFNVGTDLGNDRLIVNSNALCGNETLPLDSGNVNTQWFKFNPTTAIFDLIAPTGQFFTITSTLGSGTYKASIALNATCVSEGFITVEYDSLPTETNPIFTVCYDNDAILNTVFNLNDSDLVDEITDGNTSIIEGFYPNATFAQAQTNAILNSSNYPFTTQDETVIARIVNNAGCVNFATITLKAFQNPEIEDNETIFYCINDFPDTITLNSGLMNDDGTETIIWSFENNNIGSDDTININVTGNYTVTITNTNNCTVSRTITVEPTSLPVFERILVTENEFFRKVSIIVEVSGLGNYEYAIVPTDFTNITNDAIYQDSNIFENLNYGEYKLLIRDTNLNGCTEIFEKFIFILDYPKFVTPNNDGIYDTWNIDNFNAIASQTITSQINTVSNITIFDRIGRLVATIDPKGLGWDGTFKGEPLPSTDYWFIVNLIDFTGKVYIKKGHFSLQR